MTVDELLDAAAASVTCMPDAVTARRLEELEAERRRRSGIASARHRAELESLDLDLAAYQLARQYDDSGHLDAAARWYKMAAANDFADARYGSAVSWRCWPSAWPAQAPAITPRGARNSP